MINESLINALRYKRFWLIITIILITYFYGIRPLVTVKESTVCICCNPIDFRQTDNTYIIIINPYDIKPEPCNETCNNGRFQLWGEISRAELVAFNKDFITVPFVCGFANNLTLVGEELVGDNWAYMEVTND